MNSIKTAIIAIAISSLFYFSTSGPGYPASQSSTSEYFNDTAWQEKALTWLIASQSKDGGWGAGSHFDQALRDPHLVQSDPATTAFAAMALMKAAGNLNCNPYEEQILNALNSVLSDVETRPDNGRITTLDNTQPQTKLGRNIDASMVLEFLTMIRPFIYEEKLGQRIDTAAKVCIMLLEITQNPNGSWQNGGWAPVLQSASSINALEIASDRYNVNDSVLQRSKEYQANNIETDSIASIMTAGVPLYAIASTLRATAEDATEVEYMLNEVVVVAPQIRLEKHALSYAISTVVGDHKRAKRLAKAYKANQSARERLKEDKVWEGFGSNGGEEYLSYKMTSEALAKQDKEEWIDWRNKIEKKFIHSQNSNGSWSGHHCITSPVFCTAAVLLTWYAGDYE